MDVTLRQRLVAQQLVTRRFREPADLVRWFGAVQAQDAFGAAWAVGQRLTESTGADVERALAERRIVRTWPMRGTLHFVAAADVRWMVALLAPRVVRRSAGRHRQLGLGAVDLSRAGDVLQRALEGGRTLTRPEAYAVLERAGLSPAGQRGIHILGFHAQQGLLCIGPRRGKQAVFVLVDEWLPAAPPLDGEAALAELARRYFRSHAPATAHDFAWWAGLTLREAAVAMDGAGSIEPGPLPPARRQAALLPAWDEYLVAYKDRAAAMSHLPAGRAGSMAIGKPLILVEGRVVGSWSRRLAPASVRVGLDWWVEPSASDRRLVAREAERYAGFLGVGGASVA